MREFFQIILLRIKLFTRSIGRRGKIGIVGIFLIWGGILFVIGFLTVSYALFFYSASLGKFSEIIEFVFSAQLFFVTLLLLFQIIPTIAVDIFDEHGSMHYFLYLPIHRSVLVFSALWSGFISSPIPFIMLIPAVVAFVVVKFSAMSLLGAIAYFIFISGFALFSSAVMIRFVSTSVAKKLGRWALIVNALIFVLFFQFVPKMQGRIKGGIASGEDVFLKKYISGIMSPFSPIAWVRSLFCGDVFAVVVVLLLGYLLWRIGWQMTKNLSIEKFSPKSRRRIVDVRNISAEKFPFVVRDLTITFRDARSFFAIVYPVIFAVIMSLGFSRGVGYGLAMGAMLASQYSQIFSIRLAFLDVKYIHWSATLPVDWRKIFIRRAAALSALWTTTLVISAIILMIILKKPVQILPIVPVIFGSLFSGIFYAHRIFLAHPRRDAINPKNALGLKSLLPAFATILLVALPFAAELILKKIGLDTLYMIAVYAFVFILTGAEVLVAMASLNEKFIRNAIVG